MLASSAISAQAVLSEIFPPLAKIYSSSCLCIYLFIYWLEYAIRNCDASVFREVLSPYIERQPFFSANYSFFFTHLQAVSGHPHQKTELSFRKKQHGTNKMVAGAGVGKGTGCQV